MARFNQSARDILCNMVTEKAAEKRKSITDELEHIQKLENDDYKKRLEKARKELEQLITAIDRSILDIFKRLGLGWKLNYDRRERSFEDILHYGKLRSNLDDYIRDNSDRQNTRQKALNEEIETLDKAVSKAKQEILLRASLGMKYDEIVSIINGFQF